MLTAQRLAAAVRGAPGRYLLIGLSSFALDLGLLSLCYRVLHLPLWLATAAGFWGSFASNYLLQRRFAFGSHQAGLGSLVRYSTLLGFNTLATMGIVQLAETTGPGYVLGKVAATGATTVWNYFAYKKWVFTQPHPGHQTVQPATVDFSDHNHTQEA
ncbi:GtrA family protein [Pedococcus sp. NPDC057267]|uniref:GtrA family protein n=1 Tax=Pedococcus sp. NPDC057267 TaxID=3346077 RepID=UPI003624F9F6